MRKLKVYNQVSLDGFFVDRSGDMSWAHRHDPEWNAFVSENASGGGVLVFGRVTYDLMAGFWATAQAFEANPRVAERMNAMPKIVFSRTLGEASWRNTTVVAGDIAAEMRRLKQQPGDDMVIMGSGTIVSQLTAARLIDEYQVVVNPIILGGGRTLFDGLEEKVDLALERTRSFGNGNVVLWYELAATG